MSRFTSGTSLVCIVLALAFLSACSSGAPTTVITEPVPATVDLCLFPSQTCSGGLNVSLEVGHTQIFTATAKNNQGTAETATFSFQSSNPAVLTIASNGTACAGTWNSLTAPQVCAPGPTGMAQVTVTAHGVSSPPVTIYVHQHITRVAISKVPNQPATFSTSCFSKGAPSGPESAIYEASAFNGTADITSSVGPFAWQAVLLGGQTTSAVTLTTPPTGAPLNQEIATANTPGISLFFTSVSGTNSLPMQFETCPVQSISISALGNPATSFVVNTGTSTTLNATVTDSLGMNLVGVPLTWNSTNPISVSASGATSTVYGSVGTASAAAIGGAAVIASCTPPTCNGGISPSLPIYPRDAISFTVRSTSNPTSPTAYVTSTGCGTTTAACTPTVVPITRTSSTTPFAAGSPVGIPFAPNSILFDARGSVAYMGVDSSAFGTRSLATFTGTSASLANNIAGKVLAVSPDATSVIVSDTADVPNQVFVCSNCGGSGRSVASFLITGATAAAFSPDSLKAYIVAGPTIVNIAAMSQSGPNTTYSYSLTSGPPLQTGASIVIVGLANSGNNGTFTVTALGAGTFTVVNPSGTTAKSQNGTGSVGRPTLYVYSKLDALQTISLAGQATDVAFFPEGAFAYLAGGDSSAAVTVRRTCDNSPDPAATAATSATPIMIRALPDAATLMALEPPNIDLLNASGLSASGCPPTITNSVNSLDLEQGNFTPTQFIISSDGSAAYIVAASPQAVAVNITAAVQSSSSTTYSYNPNYGPTLEAGMSIAITGMTNPGNNGMFTVTALGTTTFTVNNLSGVTTTTPQNGTGAGTETFRLPFVIVFDVAARAASNISLSGNAAPLSASLSPAGDLLFVGADDGAVHIIDTTTLADTQQITFPFPTNALCYGPGTPATQSPVTCLPDLVAVKP